MALIRLVCAQGTSSVNGSLHPMQGADCAYLPKTVNRTAPNLFFSDKIAGANLVMGENATHIIIAHVKTRAEALYSASPPANMIDMLCKEQVRAGVAGGGRGGGACASGPACGGT